MVFLDFLWASAINRGGLNGFSSMSCVEPNPKICLPCFGLDYKSFGSPVDFALIY